MLIRWLGSPVTRRVIGPYVWGPENGWVAEVADEDAAEILGSDAKFERPQTDVHKLTEPAHRLRRRAAAGWVDKPMPVVGNTLEEKPDDQEDEQ